MILFPRERDGFNSKEDKDCKFLLPIEPLLKLDYNHA